MDPSSQRRRSVELRRLGKQLPRLNSTLLILRIIQTVLLFYFSLGYALSGPEVFLDVYVWPKNRTLPYELTIYRNTGRTWNGSIYVESSAQNKDWDAVRVLWTDPIPPGRGCTERWTCNDPRWDCDGNQWAASKLAFLDTWPGRPLPDWIAGTVYLDRYLFWIIIIGGFLGMGHNLTVLTYALAPSGTGFYRYAAGMDLVICVVFIWAGIFPISIMTSYQTADFKTTSGTPLEKYSRGLDTPQQMAFCMGWSLWALYSTTFIMNIVYVVGLDKYRNLKWLTKRYAAIQPPYPSMEIPPLRYQPPIPVDGCGEASGRDQTLNRSHGNTISRSAAHSLNTRVDRDEL